MTEESVAFFYPSCCRHADGHIYMGMSSYHGSIHSSGAAIIVSSDPDYELWLWILPQLSSIEHGRVSDKDREAFRLSFDQERQQASSAEAFREQLLAAVPICPRPTRGQQIGETIGSVLATVMIVVMLGLAFVVAAIFLPFVWLHDLYKRQRTRR